MYRHVRRAGQIAGGRRQCLDYPIGMEGYYIIERNYQWEIFRGKGALARNIPLHRICSIQLREGPGFKKNFLICWTKLLFTPAMVLPYIGHKSFTQNFTAIFASFILPLFSLLFVSDEILLPCCLSLICMSGIVKVAYGSLFRRRRRYVRRAGGKER